MTQQSGQGGSTPRYSPDGKWWWDGQQWVPAAQAPEPSRPPAPPGRPRRRRWPWAVGGLVVLFLIVIIAASVSSAGKSQKVATTATVAPTHAAAAANPATAAPAAREGSCSPQPCANDNYGWIVTVTDVKYDAPSGNDFEKPEAGNVYVTLNVTFTNKTGKEQHANPTEFVLLDGAGVKHTVAFMTACPIWEPVNLAPGATLGSKCLVFQATAGKPSGLALVWTPSLIGGSYTMKLT